MAYRRREAPDEFAHRRHSGLAPVTEIILPVSPYPLALITDTPFGVVKNSGSAFSVAAYFMLAARAARASTGEVCTAFNLPLAPAQAVSAAPAQRVPDVLPHQ
jgi:hypothetical protein